MDFSILFLVLHVSAMIPVVDGDKLLFLCCCQAKCCWFARVGKTGAAFCLTVVDDNDVEVEYGCLHCHWEKQVVMVYFSMLLGDFLLSKVGGAIVGGLMLSISTCKDNVITGWSLSWR